MRKNVKKVLSLTLMLVLVLGMLPMSAFAENDDRKYSGFTDLPTVASTTITISPDSTDDTGDTNVTSGTCGDNLTWTLDNGTLTISGTGPMRYNQSVFSAPWYGQHETITSVVIDNGVTSIGNWIFFDCTNLTSVTIPNSVTRIDRAAFYNCSAIKDVYFTGTETQWNSIRYGAYNSHLFSATIHYNSTGEGDTKPVEPKPSNGSMMDVYFLSGWSASSRTVEFGDPTRLTPFTYTLANNVNVSDISSLLNQYVLVTMEQVGDTLNYTVADIQPVDSMIGTVSATGEHTMTIDGVTYPVREDYLLAWPEGEEILYHLYNGLIVGFDALEERSGMFESWENNRVTIDGTAYPINYLTDTSFLANIERYLGSEVTYFMSTSSDNSYTPLIRINELSEPQTGIAVLSTEKSLTVQTGKSMRLVFGYMVDGLLLNKWGNMVIAVSDPTVISLSENKEIEGGYLVEVTGKKQGATNIVVSDTENGESRVIRITVRDAYAQTCSYDMNNMPSFDVQNTVGNILQTNIYDLNGLYVNNYSCKKIGNHYNVSFDVYNSKFHSGAVDIYDADGNWIDCEEISKFQVESSLWDTGEQAFYIVSDAFTGKLLTYEQASFSQHTPMSFEVPNGGYFTISNNVAESPGAFLFNACDIIFSAANKLLDAGWAADEKDVKLTAFSDLLKDEIINNETVRKNFMKIAEGTITNNIRSCAKKVINDRIADGYYDLVQQFVNIMNSQLVNIQWENQLQTVIGVRESFIEKFGGPAGTALKGCFSFASGTNQLAQAISLAMSVDYSYATVYSSIKEGYITSNGVIVNTNGNVGNDTVCQVFRVSNDDTIISILNDDGYDHQECEMYNICLVKDDQIVQPNGKVTVRIPIPKGMKGDTCTVYRKETNGSWTIITARKEGNYLVFETDHFSLYAVVGSASELSITKLPDKVSYQENEVLDTTGLTLTLNGEQISSGYICDPTVLSGTGTKKITVWYGHVSTEFDVVVQGNPYTFTDVPSDSWYYAAVQWAVEKGITNGTGVNPATFSPARECKQVEILTFLWRAAGEPVSSAQLPFTPKNSWADGALRWGIEMGMINASFNENAPCTRATAVKFMWQAAGSPSVSGDGFSDVPANADYAQAVAWAVNNGITNGTGTNPPTFSPNKTCTRAEIVTLLYRAK